MTTFRIRSSLARWPQSAERDRCGNGTPSPERHQYLKPIWALAQASGHGLLASLRTNGDGTFRVSDQHGRPIPNVALTASGGGVEYLAKGLNSRAH
jgi:hypothetical protein